LQTIWNKITQYPKIGLVLLAYIAFIALGMPDGLFGIALPSIRLTFGIPLDAVGMLLAASVAGYMTSSFLNGPIISRFGVGATLAASCLLTGLALTGYTLVPEWWMMVLLGVVAGLGAGAIDAGLNTYVAAHFGEGLMQWLHASYGIGVTIGPIIMTVALTGFQSWQAGYRAVALFQVALALGFTFTLSMWSQNDADQSPDSAKRLTDYNTPLRETIQKPQVWLSILLFFLYVGSEVSLGTWTYSLLTESRHIEPGAAGLWAGSYWATFTIGRIVAGLYAKRFSIHQMVIGGVSGAALGTLLLVWNPLPLANLAAVALIGFSIAPIFPAMMSGTSQRVGERFAANTIGMQMAATGLGTALLPSLFGILARQISLEVVPLGLLLLFATLLGIYLVASRPGKRA
jgi:fucose permease